MSTLAEYDQKNSNAISQLKEKDVKFRKFNEDIINLARTETIKELESKDGLFKEVYEEWKSFRDNIRKWSKLTALENSQDDNCEILGDGTHKTI